METLIQGIAAFAVAFSVFFSALFSSTVSSFERAVDRPFPQQPHATVLFGGDMMFDRTVRTKMEQKGEDYIFSCIDPLLHDADAVVANLEGPITDNPSKSATSTPGDEFNYTFTFATSTGGLLARHNIRIVSIGNNHIMNYSRDGLVQTKKYLSRAGVQYFGDPAAVESERVLRTTIKGIPFSFVNWSDWTSDKTDHTVAQVREEAQSGRIVVVYTHWGEEYVPVIPRVRALAHQFVDAGASIVIGSHPHVIQEHELYHGKNIYYSLGNLFFDQYWNAAVRNGLLVAATFDKSGVVALREQRVELEHDRRTCPTATTTPPVQ